MTLVLAISLICIAHIVRTLRWELFVKTYEKPNTKNLLQSLSIGYFINSFIPFKAGDLVRAWISGRKMKNGRGFALATVIVDRYLDILVVGILFAIVTVLAMITLYRSIHKHRARALEMRYIAMNQGQCYPGKIIDAGMEKETDTYEIRNEDNSTKTCTRTVPNYWVVVEYHLPEDNHPRQFRAVHMNRSAKSYIGSNVDVYVWKQWSDIIKQTLTLTYIDMYSIR